MDLVSVSEERWAVGARGKVVVVDGVPLACDDEGAAGAETLVCLHAVGHGAQDFAPLRARLGARYRIVAVDWPSHGSSGPDPRGEPTASRYAELLSGLLDALRIHKPVLLGNSIGGAAAIELAARAPGRARGLVLLDPGGLVTPSPWARAACSRMARFFEAGARGASFFRWAYPLYCRAVIQNREGAEQRARIAAVGPEMAPLLARAWRGFAEPAADLRDAAARVDCPVLVAWATRDVVNPRWANRAGIACFPHATQVTFSAGHNPALETPDAFARALVAFLDALPP